MVRRPGGGDGWSRGVLEDRIKGQLYARVGPAPSNFPNRLEFTADLIFLQYNPAVRFIVVELKVGRFDPRDAGQLSFYVEAVERRFRNPALHAATIGILLCTSRDDQVVEYSLASTAAPVAVATYTYDQLPDDVRQALPPADSITRAIDNTERQQPNGPPREAV